MKRKRHGTQEIIRTLNSPPAVEKVPAAKAAEDWIVPRTTPPRNRAGSVERVHQSDRGLA